MQAHTPGRRAVLVFDAHAPRGGHAGGIAPVDFRRIDPADIAEALQAVEHAGGTIRRGGACCPGAPSVCCTDPEGSEVAIWHGWPPPIDPPAPRPPAEAVRR